jgi:hypothetical protein
MNMIAPGSFEPDQPMTEWLTEPESDRRMKLLRTFEFRDPKFPAGTWVVPANYDGMDGASIPRALWSLVGSPYTGDYRRASIVHDYACDQNVPRSRADRMFYRACRAGGCSVGQSILLYIGVRIGAWLKGHRQFSALVADEEQDLGPRLFRSSAESRIENVYQRVAQKMALSQYFSLAQDSTQDDAEAIEPVVDAAIDEEFAREFAATSAVSQPLDDRPV